MIDQSSSGMILPSMILPKSYHENPDEGFTQIHEICVICGSEFREKGSTDCTDNLEKLNALIFNRRR
jgi:hypothetical protein